MIELRKEAETPVSHLSRQVRPRVDRYSVHTNSICVLNTAGRRLSSIRRFFYVKFLFHTDLM